MRLVKIERFNEIPTYIGSLIFDRNERRSFLNDFNGLPFIYFLYYGNEVVYIGSSSSIYSRICTHVTEKIFDKVLICQFTDEKIAQKNEQMLILELKPKLNKRYSRITPPKSRRKKQP